MNSKFLDFINDEKFYQNHKSSFLESFFTFLGNELKVMTGIQLNDIFAPMFYEIIHKVVLMFLVQIQELIKDEKFEMPILYLNLLLNDFLSFKNIWKSFSKKLIKAFMFEADGFNWCTRYPHFVEISVMISEILLNKLIDYIKEVIKTYIYSTRLDKINFKYLCDQIEKKQQDFGLLATDFSSQFETKKHDIILETLTNKIAAKKESNVCDHIDIARDNFISYLKAKSKLNLDDQVVYIEQLASFYSNNENFKCQNALSIIQKLLSFKLSKQTLVSLIETKKNSKNKILIDFLNESINSHFEKSKEFEKTIEFHKKCTKKLTVAINCLKIISKFKLLKFRSDYYKKMSSTGLKENAIQVYVNSHVNFDIPELKKGISVRFQIVNRHYLRTKFKGYDFNEV